MPEPLADPQVDRAVHQDPAADAGGHDLAFTAFVSLGLTRLWYDNNLLNMQAVGLESVELEQQLLSECNQSVWYALSIADSREELLARKAKFKPCRRSSGPKRSFRCCRSTTKSSSRSSSGFRSSWPHCPNVRR